MKKSLKLSLGSVVVAGALGAVLLPATGASAAEGYACPTGTDTIEVPYEWTGYTPDLAGTVCVKSGTTLFATMNVTPGWQAQLKSDGSDGRTDVKFSQTSTSDRVELRYQAGRTEIK